jgi:hypothetical protein
MVQHHAPVATSDGAVYAHLAGVWGAGGHGQLSSVQYASEHGVANVGQPGNSRDAARIKMQRSPSHRVTCAHERLSLSRCALIPQHADRVLPLAACLQAALQAACLHHFAVTY